MTLVNILNTFTGQTSATGDVCRVYYVSCSRLFETNCTFLQKGKSLQNKNGFLHLYSLRFPYRLVFYLSAYDLIWLLS